MPRSSKPGKPKVPSDLREETTWSIDATCTFRGEVSVQARSAEEAMAKAKAGDFEFEFPLAELSDWSITGKPKSDA